MDQTKQCQNCKNEFAIRPEDMAFYGAIGVSAPTLCPQCRYQRRLINRNEWSMYRRTCDATGQTIVSIFNERAPFPVYSQKYWWSDEWDPLSYGQDYDFSRPFFEQFRELLLKVPHLAIANNKSVNSEYTNQSNNNKDCYFIVSSSGSEKCLYGNWYEAGCHSCSDCLDLEKSELCYECVSGTRLYSCSFCQDISDSSFCHFSYDLKGCSHCFGCTGLRNKQYCFFNEQLSKEAYEERIQKMVWTREFIEEMKKKAYVFSLKFPRKYYHGLKNIDFSGDYLGSTKNIHLGFNCKHAETIAYGQDAWWSKDSWDVTEVFSELCYECQGVIGANSIGLRSCWEVHDSYYSDMCFSSSDLFGCVGLRQKHYCILNKQYTKEAFGKLKTEIIEHMKKTGEWGEYYPASLTPFGYNESVAQDHFPLTKEAAIAKGYTWYERPERTITVTKHTGELPKTIKEVDETILKEVIQCGSQDTPEGKAAYPLCAQAFTVVPLELELYRSMEIPLPEKCFPCRRQDRYALRNPRRLWPRACQCTVKANHFHADAPCPNRFETTYAPERPEIIYCEECYTQEVA